MLVASYDLLLGYTGIVSFAHTMFFGIGGYGVAIALYGLGPSWGALAPGIVAALALSLALALVIGLFSLRVRAIFFAMITLAVASAFQVLASQLSWLTGGEDGRTFKLPDVLPPGFRWLDRAVVRRQRSTAADHLLSALLRRRGGVPGAAAHRQLAVRPGAAGDPRKRFPRRGARLPHRGVSHARQLLAALAATLAGALSALWLRYNGPDTSLSFEIMIDILLMVVIGGMGTLYGAIIGATIFILAQSYLQDVMAARRRPPPRRACRCCRRCSIPTAGCSGSACPRAVGVFLPDRHRRRPAGPPTVKGKPAGSARPARPWPGAGARIRLHGRFQRLGRQNLQLSRGAELRETRGNRNGRRFSGAGIHNRIASM